MKITIHTPGFHSADYSPLIEKYSKQISRFQELHWDIVSGRDAIEERRQLAKVLPVGYIALDGTGKNITTGDIADKLESCRMLGRDLNFAIGGADGLGENIRDGAEEIWAFGAITLPHQLARLILAEQLYRAATILAGHPYHRE